MSSSLKYEKQIGLHMAYKHDYDKILTRLTVILSRMNDGEALSVKELAEEFNVSTKTIQRDMNERLISFPIYQENKKWKMADGFKLEKTTSIEDAIVLDIIDKLTESIGTSFYSKAKKILSKIKNDDFNPIYAKLDIEDITDKLKEIQLLETAIQDKKIVKCHYNFEKYSHELTIKPLKIVNFEGFWYLVALDNRNDILKKYYLKNISSLKLLDENFTTTSKLDELLDQSISVWFQEDNEPFEVKLFVSDVIAKYFKRKPLSKNQVIESIYEDGSMDIVVKITHDMEILPIVKYWLPHLRVIEPKWIQDELTQELKEYLKN
jgi:predicted DNA-binding transcriptional regulator YafY